MFDLVGEDVLITGAGPIGMMAAAIARHAGARHIVITDVNDYRLNLAAKMGATRAVNVSPLVQPRESAGRRQFRDCATCDRRRLCRPDAFAYPDCEQPLDDGRKAGGRKPGDADALQRAIGWLLGDGALRHDDIRRAIGCGTQRVLPALRTLMAAGTVRCDRRGGAKYYSLTGKEPPHAD